MNKFTKKYDRYGKMIFRWIESQSKTRLKENSILQIKNKLKRKEKQRYLDENFKSIKFKKTSAKIIIYVKIKITMSFIA